MEIILNKVSKRFGQYYILRNVDYHFKSQQVYGVSGSNGSGKSTLLKVLSGYLSFTKGHLTFMKKDKEINRNELYQGVCMVAPYIDLVEDFDIREMYNFHKSFKEIPKAITLKTFREILNYPAIKPGKLIKHYSSGMKKRLALALNVLSSCDLLLLDEPTSFLDAEGIDWFNNLLAENKGDKTIIIASNDAADFKLCKEVIKMGELNS